MHQQQDKPLYPLVYPVAGAFLKKQ